MESFITIVIILHRTYLKFFRKLIVLDAMLEELLPARYLAMQLEVLVVFVKIMIVSAMMSTTDGEMFSMTLKID